MFYPTIGERVRVRGRVDGYAVISTDYIACVAGICLDFDGVAVQESESVPFNMLLEYTKYVGAQSESGAHASRLATVNQVVHATVAQIHRSTVLIADIQDSISMTLQVIRNSQQLIIMSDLAIAQMKTLGCT